MKLNDVIARSANWYKSGKSIYLKSAPGRGKTEVLSATPAYVGRQLGMNLGLIVLNGPLLTPADSIGYLVPRKVTGEDGVEHMESMYTDPFWFRTREGKRLDQYEGGIIVVDEADKMDVDVKKVIGEAALSGRLGPHQIPDGWRIWMAGNRQRDRSGSTKELDHLINRRMEIDITDDIDSWNDWASRSKRPHGGSVSAITRAFANQNTEIVFADGVPEKQGPWCTPRSMVEADDYLTQYMDKDGNLPDDPLLAEEVGGMIGDGAAAQLQAFILLQREMPSYKDIIANPGTVKVPGKPDAAMLICYNLAMRVTEAEATPVMDYVNRLPKEFGVVFGRSAATRNPKLVVTPGFSKWVKENASLMAAIGNHAR